MSILNHAVAPRRFVADLFFGQWSGFTPPLQYSGPLSATPVEITVAEQKSETLIGVNLSNLGETLDSGNTPTGTPAKVTFKASTASPIIMALALGGTVTEVTQSASAISDETVIIPAIGNGWARLANQGIAAHGVGTEILVETAGTPDVEVASTKYEINLEAGLIRALHADAVGSKKVSYHLAARTSNRYAAGSAVSQYVHILGIAKDQKSGYTAPLHIWRASLSSKTKFDATTNKFLEIELEGDLVLPKDATGAWIAIGGRTPANAWEFDERTA